MSTESETHVLLGDASKLVLFAVLVVERIGGVCVCAEVEESAWVEGLWMWMCQFRWQDKMVRYDGVWLDHPYFGVRIEFGVEQDGSIRSLDMCPCGNSITVLEGDIGEGVSSECVC